MLITSVKSFKLIAWKLWEELITQTCYPILKPNLKIVYVQNAVILSKLILLLAKNHMHIFIMLITSVQSFKLIACIPWEELITQTCYPTLKANLNIVLSQKCRNFVKNYFFVCKKFTCTSSIYPQQVCMVSKWSIETCKRSWLHKLYSLQCKKLPKMTKFERL